MREKSEDRLKLEQELADLRKRWDAASVQVYELKRREDSVKQQLEDIRKKEAAAKANDFVRRLEEEHGVVGHPKAGLLFSKAWDLGHAYGESEVANYYADLVELIK